MANQLDLKYSFDPPNEVYISSPSQTGNIANTLQFNITHPGSAPLVQFKNEMTPGDKVPPITETNPGFRLDRIYIYFIWGGGRCSTNALCSLEASTGITVSPGPDATSWYVSDLMTDPTLGSYWTLYPKTTAVLEGQQQISFILKNIITQVAPGSPLIYVRPVVETYEVDTIEPANTFTKAAPVSIQSFTRSPSTPIQLGTPVNLLWNAWADYTILNGGTTHLPRQETSPGMKVVPSLSQDTYTLQAFYNDGTSSPQKNLIVHWAPTINPFTASPTTIIKGGAATLSWKVGQAESCSIDQGVGVVDNTSGTKQVYPTATTTYTLTATGNNASETKSAKVTVVDAWEKTTGGAPWPSLFFAPGVLWVNNTLFVIDQAAATVWSSADGKTWKPITDSAPWTKRLGGSVVSFNGQLWLMGGTKIVNKVPTAVLNDVWASSDGKTWTQVTGSTRWCPRTGQGTLTINDRLYLMGGNTSYTTLKMVNDVWSSSDGVSWTQTTANAPWKPRLGFGAASFDNKLWLMAGATSVSSKAETISENLLNDVWWSSDGVTWNEQTKSAAWAARSAPNVAVLGDGALYLMGGFEKVIDGSIEYGAKDMWSMDAAGNWTKLSMEVPAVPVGVELSKQICLYEGVGTTSSPTAIWLLGGGLDSFADSTKSAWRLGT